MTFKESITNKLFLAADQYKKLIGYDFVIESDSFIFKKRYILRFNEDNFLHLTGIKSNLCAKTFFEKCFARSLQNCDFDCESTNELKGKVREKMRNLSDIGSFFDKHLLFQESFEKNRVKCKIATSDGKCTLGFVCTKNDIHVPLTLLNRNQLNEEKTVSVFSISKKQIRI